MTNFPRNSGLRAGGGFELDPFDQLDELDREVTDEVQKLSSRPGVSAYPRDLSIPVQSSDYPPASLTVEVKEKMRQKQVFQYLAELLTRRSSPSPQDQVILRVIDLVFRKAGFDTKAFSDPAVARETAALLQMVVDDSQEELASLALEKKKIDKLVQVFNQDLMRVIDLRNENRLPVIKSIAKTFARNVEVVIEGKMLIFDLTDKHLALKLMTPFPTANWIDDDVFSYFEIEAVTGGKKDLLKPAILATDHLAGGKYIVKEKGLISI